MTLKFILILCIVTSTPKKEYVKNLNEMGTVVSEGWMLNNKKVDFWTFYYDNGSIEKKGHYSNDKKTDYWYFYGQNSKLLKEGSYNNNQACKWWIFYSENKKRKIQFKNGEKNGYCLVYINNRLKKAELYESDRKTGEWTSYFSFKRDNPNVKF